MKKLYEEAEEKIEEEKRAQEPSDLFISYLEGKKDVLELLMTYDFFEE